MRAILITLVGIFALASCQQVPYQQVAQNAQILTDARYLSGDGTFGSAYSQEDGVEFKEESDVNGDRRGSYSYVDPTGQRRTVTYTAGKNGFQATGDHIPTAAPQVAPQPEYTPLPQYNSPDYQVNEEYQPQQKYRPEPRPQQEYVPQYRPQVQPQYQSPPAQYQPQPQSRYRSQSQPQYQPQPQPQYQPQPRPQPQYNSITTPAPHRFFPPGKLDFNRTPDGFSYTFSKS